MVRLEIVYQDRSDCTCCVCQIHKEGNYAVRAARKVKFKCGAEDRYHSICDECARKKGIVW